MIRMAFMTDKANVIGASTPEANKDQISSVGSSLLKCGSTSNLNPKHKEKRSCP